MRTFKFFNNEEPNYMEEEPTISRYDDYDTVVLNRLRYVLNPFAEVYRFEMNGGSKAIIIKELTHNDNNLPLVETVTIEYELFHIELNQPNIMHNRQITMSVDMYNEIRR